MNNKSLGQIAFEAYKKAKQGTTYDNKPIPEWEDLTDGDVARNAWEEAARAVADRFQFDYPGRP